MRWTIKIKNMNINYCCWFLVVTLLGFIKCFFSYHCWTHAFVCHVPNNHIDQCTVPCAQIVICRIRKKSTRRLQMQFFSNPFSLLYRIYIRHEWSDIILVCGTCSKDTITQSWIALLIRGALQHCWLNLKCDIKLFQLWWHVGSVDLLLRHAK